MSLKSANQTEKNVCTLEVTISGEDFKAAVSKVYNKQKGSITIPGFRKGKAPRAIIEKFYGSGVFYEDALEDLYPNTVTSAIEEAGIDAVSAPYDVDVKEMDLNGVLMELKVATKPEITLTAYKGLSAEKGSVKVEDVEVDAELSTLQDRNSRTVTIEDRAVKDGDITVIDFDGYVDGVAFDGGKSENYSLTIGSGQFIPGFEEQIIGHSIGEDFDVNVTFPEEYAPELAGKDAVFKIKLHEIKEKQLPDLDDEFAKDVSEFDTLDEYKNDLKKSIEQRKTEEVQKAYEDKIFDQLIENVQGEIPQVMFDDRAEQNARDFEQRLSSQGMNLDIYLQYLGMDMDAFKSSMAEQAVGQVKMQLALEKITELEGIEAPEEEVEAKYQELAEMYKMEADAVKGIIPSDDIKKEITNTAAVKFVVDNSKVKKAPAKKAAPKKDEDGEKAEKAEKAPAKKTPAKKAPAKKAPAKKAPAKKTAEKKVDESAE